MAAPKENKFWLLRSKHGADRIFSSGDMIIEAANEFMEALYKNPRKEHAFVGKEAREVSLNKLRVPTWSRFAGFCRVHSGYFKDLRADLKGKTDEVSKDISAAISRVDDLFFAEKFEAASAGLANASLIGKYLGITEVQKVDLTTKGKEIKDSSKKQTIINVSVVPPTEID